MHNKFIVWQTRKFAMSATRFACSECLAEKGRNPLGALSRIESVDSKSHEAKS